MGTHADRQSVPNPVISAFGLIPESIAHAAGGHINRTYTARLAAGTRCVLQRVNPIFPAEVNYDFDAVTVHLRRKGHTSPTLLRTASGALWFDHDGGVWRAQSHIEGMSTETLATARQAAEAGSLLGRFHAALTDLQHEFRSVRSDPHDTARHLATLEKTLRTHAGHPAFAVVQPVASAILRAAEALVPLPDSPVRVVHGDPKISNVIFDRHSGAAVCLVDLDTLGLRPVASELGDAFRSWCNPAGEDSPDATFDPAMFEAAIAGYADGSAGALTATELQSIPAATGTIAVELAARFCADALNEAFFGWDPTRFASASAHNLARAQAQLRVALATAGAEAQMHRAIERARRP